MSLLAAFIAAFTFAWAMTILAARAEHKSANGIGSHVAQFNRPARFYRVPRGDKRNPFKPSTKGKTMKLKEHGKYLLAIALAVAGLAIIMTGCQTPGTPPPINLTNVAKAAQIVKVTVQSGVMADLIANPQHRADIQKATDALTAGIDSGTITGGTLAGIVATLPIKSDTVRVVGGALLIYDVISVFWMTPESNAAVLLIATAVRDGAQQGLALAGSPAKQLQAAKVRPPAPTKANTRAF